MTNSKSKSKLQENPKNPKNQSHRSSNPNNDGNDAVESDSRFMASTNRPQFVGIQTKKFSSSNKVQIDSRFASVLTDPRFRVDGSSDGANNGMDKYGRRKKKKKKKKDKGEYQKEAEEELSAFYTIEKPQPDDNDTNNNNNNNNDDDDKEPNAKLNKSESEESNENENEKMGNPEEDEDEPVRPKDSLSRIAYLQALSRGEISGSSTSESSSEDDTDDDSDDDLFDINDKENDPMNVTPGILDPSRKHRVNPPTEDAGTTDDPQQPSIEITMEESPYLAVLNLDWVHVRAVDIYVILNSFAPPGSLKRVRVYPSDFGLEQMKKEEIMGPTGIWKQSNSNKTKIEQHDDTDDDDDDDTDDDTDQHSNTEQDETNDENENDEQLIQNAYKHFAPNEQMANNLLNDANNPGEETDFDTEKLREYEASKLRYYFAVAEFETAKDADVVYREVDGLEMEHSSAAFDLRSIAPDQIYGVIEKRKLRDMAINIPSNYVPPDFVVSALQQTNVKCTWEDDDVERSRKLTQYGVANGMWDAMVEGDDLKAYMASDHSSEDESQNDEHYVETDKTKKTSKMRMLLGLSSDDEDIDQEDDDDDQSDEGRKQNDKQHPSHSNNEPGTKVMTYIPGKKDLTEKIRTKIQTKQNTEQEDTTNLTPWETYLAKRNEKKREKRKMRKEKRKNGTHPNEEHHNETNPKHHTETSDIADDDFFMVSNKSHTHENIPSKDARKDITSEESEVRLPSTEAELELILAGDHDIEAAKDYDMRGIMRVEKNAGKKLRGARKRKESNLAKQVMGQDFKVDTTDERFAALLDGDDRFGIDRQDPNFKDTTVMKTILAEQKRRRHHKRTHKNTDSNTDSNWSDADKGTTNNNNNNNNNTDLNSLVTSIKNRVEKVNKKKRRKKG